MTPPFSSILERTRGSDTGKAAGLAGAMIINNLIALIVSVVFARLLNDYGAFAALVSYLVILTVFGQAIQVATAREGVLGHLGEGEGLLETLENWARTLTIFTVVATVVSVLLRQPIADLVGVPRQSWAAAMGVPGGCAYLAVCTLRGALQSVGDYRTVGISLIGEQGVRLIAGAVLVEAGTGVGGAFLASLIAYVAMSAYCAQRLYGQLAAPNHRRWSMGPRVTGATGFGRHVWASAVPITALGIVQLLQNVDLITAKHQFTDRVASAYSVDAVAAKVLIWVAMGASFYLVPETSRRRSSGEETRGVLLATLGIVAICAVPCLLIYAFGAHPLLEAVFGKKRAIASDALLPLGAAFTVLAATYLAVQYMLAMRRVWFLAALALVAAVEPVLLLHASRHPASFAEVVLVVQLIGAGVSYAIALLGRPRSRLEEAELLV